MSIFSGLETARRALMSQQQALNVTNHNVANANTPGFSRQTAVFATTPPYTLGQNLASKTQEMGTGVKVEDINRMRDTFLDFQYRAEIKEFGRWEVRRDTLQKLEVIINEPSDGGLGSVLENFWEGWQELSKNPESVTVRSIVLDEATALVDTLHHLDRELNQLVLDLNQTLEIQVEEINSIAKQIADLNSQILRVEARSQRANDLRDKRDLLLDELAKLTGVQVSEKQDGTVDVVIGNRSLVDGGRYTLLTVSGTPDDLSLSPVWEDGLPLHVNGGTLLGIEEARSTVAKKQDDLESLVQTLAEAVNDLHREGYGLDGEDGRDFFVSRVDGAEITLANIAVNPQLLDNPALIAAAADPEELPGEGLIAMEIGKLQHTPPVGGTSSITDFYNSLVAQLGIEAREANRMASNQDLLTQQIDQRREMVSGVSLDEEMANMVRFQHAYNAAARMVTAIDEMMEVLVNRMGIVGR